MNDREASSPTAVAVYARISQDADGDMLGVNRQLEDCRAYCAKRGWQILGEYVDNDISAYSGKRRPEFRRLLQDIQEGRISGVVAWHLDRLYRQPRELEEFLDVCDVARVRHLGTFTGDIDLATEDGRCMARILCAVGRKESDAMSRRVRRKMLEIAQAGRPHGGVRAYGFEKDNIAHRPAEVAVLREAKDRMLVGESLNAVCADFEARGIKSTTGKRWAPTSLRNCLVSHRVAGRREMHGQDVSKAIWEPILDEPEWLRLRALLLNPARRTSRSARSYLLTGYLRCGLCGAKLVAHPRLHHRTYTCQKGPKFVGCGRIRIAAEPLEEFVSEAVLYRLDSDVLQQALAGSAVDPDQGQLIAAITDDEAQFEELAKAWAGKSITLKEWLSAREIIEARLAASRAQLSRHDRHRAIREVAGRSDELRRRWPALNLDQRRAIIAGLLDRIVVGPATSNRFDQGRLDPVWRL